MLGEIPSEVLGQLDLTAEGRPDYDHIAEAIAGAKVVYLQRSRGYSLRPALSVADIAKIVDMQLIGNGSV